MMAPDQTTVDRIVVRAPNWLGDAVLALPAMGALRRHFKDAHLTVAAPAGVAPMLAMATEVAPDALLVLSGGSRAHIEQLRGGKFDLGVLFPNSFRTAWDLWRAGVPQRWGYPTSQRGRLLTRRSTRAEVPRGTRQHHADYYRALVRGLGIPVGDEAPSLTVPPVAQAAARARVASADRSTERLILCAPGAAYGQAKQWPPVRVAELIARLTRDRDVDVVLVGAAHDRDAGIAIDRWLDQHAPLARPRVVNLIGHTDLPTLAALAAISRVCITNDSGAMHVAAATGRPVVALFGPTDERVTSPLGRGDVLKADVFCRPCHLRDCPIDHRCMKRITVDMVASAVSRHLAFSGARS